MQEHALKTRGLVYYTNPHQPGRPTLLLIHGFSASSSGWRAFEGRWQETFNLIVPDLRGHGKSRRYPRLRDYAIEQHAQDLAVVLEQLHITRCVVVGYSWGVDIALELEKLRPAVVEKLVLIAPLYRLTQLWRVTLGRPLLWLVDTISTLVPTGVYKNSYVDYQRFTNAGDESPTRIAADLIHTGPRAYFHSLRHIVTFKDDASFASVAAPTLILCGAHDTLSPPHNAELLMQDMPHATLEIIADGGHMLPYHNAKEVAEKIEAFVQNPATALGVK